MSELVLRLSNRLPVVSGLRFYFLCLGAVMILWLIGMQMLSGWGWFREHWEMSVTMVFGSFVAGATPAGGASVAFPVFTKLLGIDSRSAATFGLMIQSVGMTMAAVLIVARRIPIYTRVFRWGSAGGCLGVLLGIAFLSIPAPFPKLLFTCLVLSFAIALWCTRRPDEARPEESLAESDRRRFLITGFIGGLLASQTGSGADMLAFMVMMMACHLEGKRAIPTSVTIMAVVSVAGFVGLLIVPSREIGVVWEYWAVCVPIVAVGAPLGAYVISRVPPRWVMMAVMGLIAVEVVSTFFVVPMTLERVGFVVITLSLAGLMQWHLHRLSKVQAKELAS